MHSFREELKSSRKKTGGLIAVLLFLVLLLTAVLVNIRTVHVMNNHYYTEEEAVGMIFPEAADRNTVICWFRQNFLEHKRFPLIIDYRVEYLSPTECNLILYENDVVGCIEYMSSYMFFDKDGMIVENSEERPEGVILIRGIRFSDISLGRNLFTERKELFREILAVKQQLESKEISCDIIDVSDLDDISVLLRGGDITVRLGSNAELPAKVSVLADMLPGLRERKLRGVLDLRDYSDRTKDNVSYFRAEK